MTNNILELSGPINIIRLEGNVETINKVLYLFTDHHNPVDEQTKCKSKNSMHCLKYIKKIAREHPDKIIDFFIEAGNINYIYGEKKMYIESAINFYANEKKESNIRAHYIDIREYNNIIKSFLNLMDVLIYQMVKK